MSALLSAAPLTALLAFGTAQPRAAKATEETPHAEMVGEGTVSTPADEFGGALSPDGRSLYFDLSVPPHYLYVMCVSHQVNGKWNRPEVLPFSGEYRDSDPVLSPDGNTLYFASDRPVHGTPSRRFSIWVAKKTPTGWSEPEVLEGPVNDPKANQDFASVATNGNLYFTSDRKGDFDVYRARLVDGIYQEVEDLGPEINGAGIDSLEAFIAPDESYLLVGSFGRPGGLGNSDVFISYNHGGVWSKPINLGPEVNTPAREYSPRVSPDGKWLYFTSERGMQTEERTAAFTYDEFVKRSRGVRNGLGNIYRIPMEFILRTTRP